MLIFIVLTFLFVFNRCHPSRLSRSCSGSFRDRQQSVAYLEEERPRPRAARRPVFLDQEGRGHPQALGAQS